MKYMYLDIPMFLRSFVVKYKKEINNSIKKKKLVVFYKNLELIEFNNH